MRAIFRMYPKAHVQVRTAVGLCLFLLFLIHDHPAWSKDNPPSSPVVDPAAGQPVAMGPSKFLKLLVERSVEIQYARKSAEVSHFLAEGERGLYEPTAFITPRIEGRRRQRTAEEITQNIFTQNEPVLTEQGRSGEIGLRQKLPSGAEMAISYKFSRKSNNLISLTATQDTEFNASLNLTIKQPLLRNAGRSITETDLKISELEDQVAAQQFQQQISKSAIEGLAQYWQVYREQAMVQLLQDSIIKTEDLIASTRARAKAGLVADSTALEAQSALLNRQAELARGERYLKESQSRLATMLDLDWSSSWTLFVSPTPTEESPPTTIEDPSDQKSLNQWHPYQVANLKLQQARVRLAFAANQTRPSVDFVMSYAGTGYSLDPIDTRNTAFQRRFPDWYVGINVEIPIKGNQRAQQHVLAQQARLEQATVDVDAIERSFMNDLRIRRKALDLALLNLNANRDEEKLRQEIFNIEQRRMRLGIGSLGETIRRYFELVDASKHLIESRANYETAAATLMYTQGKLLSAHGILVVLQNDGAN